MTIVGAVLALLLLALQTPPSAAQAASADAERLLAFKASLSNRAAVLASWVEGTDPCTKGWQGISCSARGRVERMALSEMELEGTIPAPSGWALPELLTKLDLSYNEGLLGPLPPAWRLPAGLQELLLDRTTLNSSLSPEWVANLPTGLTYIGLKGCNLTGALPPAPNLPKLWFFDLAINQLTGTVPHLNLRSLRICHLHTNKLNGSIPSNFTFDNRFPNFMLNLYKNDLSGSLPQWPNVDNAQVVIKPGNPNLCGDLPTTPKYAEYEQVVNLYEPVPTDALLPCPGAEEASSTSESNTAVIAGVSAGVVGGAVLFGLVGLAFWKRRQRRLQKDQLVDPKPGNKGSDDSGASAPEEQLSCELPAKDALLESSHSPPRSASSPSHSGGSASRKDQAPKAPHAMTSLSLGVDVGAYLIQWSQLGVKKQIGRGASSRVYVAAWKKTLVAAKLLLGPDAPDIDITAAADRVVPLSNPVLGNLKTEANLMAPLRHPNILGFFGVCLQPPVIVVEYCPRGSLYDVLKRVRETPELVEQLTWPLRLNIALGGARGFLYLHSLKPPVLHRDFKSPNLLLDANYNAKVADFNMSRIIGESSLAFQHSMTVGNPRWLAPEVLDGGTHSFSADVFSFSIVMWELLTLQPPWEGEKNQWQVSGGVIKGQRPPIPEPDQLLGGTFDGLDAYVELMKSCWAQDPADRPPFQEVVQRLSAIYEQLTGVTTGSTTPEHSTPPSSADAAKTPRGGRHTQQGTSPTHQGTAEPQKPFVKAAVRVPTSHLVSPFLTSVVTKKGD